MVLSGLAKTLSKEHSEGSDFINQNFLVMGYRCKDIRKDKKKTFPIGVALHPESEESRVVASEAGFGEATRASAQPAPSPATGWVKHWNKES